MSQPPRGFSDCLKNPRGYLTAARRPGGDEHLELYEELFLGPETNKLLFVSGRSQISSSAGAKLERILTLILTFLEVGILPNHSFSFSDCFSAASELQNRSLLFRACRPLQNRALRIKMPSRSKSFTFVLLVSRIKQLGSITELIWIREACLDP